MKFRPTLAEKTIAEVKKRKYRKEENILLACLSSYLLVGLYIICFIPFSEKKPAPVDVSGQASFGPPDVLNINGERWRVEPFQLHTGDFGGLIGLTNCDKRMIWYDTGRMTKYLFRETMWHEIMHASHCGKERPDKANWKWGVDSKEHGIIYELGMSTTQFVHDNPEFMKWAEDWK